MTVLTIIQQQRVAACARAGEVLRSTVNRGIPGLPGLSSRVSSYEVLEVAEFILTGLRHDPDPLPECGPCQDGDHSHHHDGGPCDIVIGCTCENHLAPDPPRALASVEEPNERQDPAHE